jgi:uncharacterized protein (TIGR03067 family)
LTATRFPRARPKARWFSRENKYTFTTGTGERGGGTFTLDPSKTPKQMNVVPLDGPLKGETIEDIYEVDGDSLKLCMALPGTKRATEFKSEAGSGLWLFTYKRAK